MSKEPQLNLLWKVWTEQLPAKFRKADVVEALSNRWGVSRENVYRLLKKGVLKNFVHDVSFLHTNYGIGFNMDNGFFFDASQYDAIQQREEMESAKVFGLSKSIA